MWIKDAMPFCSYRYSNTFMPSAIPLSQRNASNEVIYLFFIDCRGKQIAKFSYVNKNKGVAE